MTGRGDRERAARRLRPVDVAAGRGCLTGPAVAERGTRAVAPDRAAIPHRPGDVRQPRGGGHADGPRAGRPGHRARRGLATAAPHPHRETHRRPMRRGRRGRQPDVGRGQSHLLDRPLRQLGRRHLRDGRPRRPSGTYTTRTSPLPPPSPGSPQIIATRRPLPGSRPAHIGSPAAGCGMLIGAHCGPDPDFFPDTFCPGADPRFVPGLPAPGRPGSVASTQQVPRTPDDSQPGPPACAGAVITPRHRTPPRTRPLVFNMVPPAGRRRLGRTTGCPGSGTGPPGLRTRNAAAGRDGRETCLPPPAYR